MKSRFENLEYLAARVHGRYARMPDATRWGALSAAQGLPELCQKLSLGPAESGPNLERRFTQALVNEVAELAAQCDGALADFLNWLLVYFQLENLKRMLRRALTGGSAQELQSALLPVSGRPFALSESLAKENSLESFVQHLPRSLWKDTLRRAMSFPSAQSVGFFLEAALDRTYFSELLAKARRLPGADETIAMPEVMQEIDIFHLLLVMRGKFIYGLENSALLPLHVDGTRISRACFERMLQAKDVVAAAATVVGLALDHLPTNEAADAGVRSNIDASSLEQLAWSRLCRLAHRAFRQSHMGAAAVIAYVALRRIEVMNLIRVCEGARLNLAAEQISKRLLTRGGLKEAHV